MLDVVANHINGSSSHRAAKWNNTAYWHSSSFKGINYSNRYSITNDNLGDYPDLKSEHAEVRAAVAAFIQTIKEQGVKGIRWDAAKHIALPSEGCQFWPDVTLDGLWHYGEILDSTGGDENKLMAEYTKVYVGDRYPLLQHPAQCYPRRQLDNVLGLLTTRGIAADKLVYWAESHDTYANDGGATKNVSQDVYRPRMGLWVLAAKVPHRSTFRARSKLRAPK